MRSSLPFPPPRAARLDGAPEFSPRGLGSAARAVAVACLSVLLPVVAVPPLAAEPVTVTQADGPLTLPAHPQRVLVLDPPTLDTLDALGVDVAGVAGTNLPSYLGKYRDPRYAKVGTLFEPDYEAIAAAAPDLIVIGPRMAAKRRDLSAIAPTADLTIDDHHFLEGAERNVELLGRVFGKEDAARALRARMDEATGRVKSLAPGAGTVLMVMVNGGKLTAFGPGSRFGWLHDDLGIRPAVAGLQAATHGEVISFEFILKTDPDWIFVLDRDAAVGHAGTAARQVMDNDIVAATRAARAGRILYLDPERWYISAGGGAAVSTVAGALADAFARGKAP